MVSKGIVVKEKSAWFWYQHWLVCEGMSRMRNRGRERWTGWLEPGAPTAGRAPLPAPLSNSSTICLVYLAQLCSKLLSFNGLIFSPQFSGPLPVSTGAYIIDWINSLLIVLQM